MAAIDEIFQYWSSLPPFFSFFHMSESYLFELWASTDFLPWQTALESSSNGLQVIDQWQTDSAVKQMFIHLPETSPFRNTYVEIQNLLHCGESCTAIVWMGISKRTNTALSLVPIRTDRNFWASFDRSCMLAKTKWLWGLFQAFGSMIN